MPLRSSSNFKLMTSRHRKELRGTPKARGPNPWLIWPMSKSVTSYVSGGSLRKVSLLYVLLLSCSMSSVCAIALYFLYAFGCQWKNVGRRKTMWSVCIIALHLLKKLVTNLPYYTALSGQARSQVLSFGGARYISREQEFCYMFKRISFGHNKILLGTKVIWGAVPLNASPWLRACVRVQIRLEMQSKLGWSLLDVVQSLTAVFCLIWTWLL